MSNSQPHKDLGTAIAAAMSAYAVGTNLFYAPEAPVDDNVPAACVFIYPPNRGAAAPELSCDDDAYLRHRLAEVHYRGEKQAWDDSEQAAEDLWKTCQHLTVSGYQEVYNVESQPRYQGRDDEGRPHFAFVVALEQADGSPS